MGRRLSVRLDDVLCRRLTTEAEPTRSPRRASPARPYRSSSTARGLSTALLPRRAIRQP
jgi:hypothetical protein